MGTREDEQTQHDEALTQTALDAEPSTAPRSETDHPRRGEMIGRFVVHDRLGAGAMGVVLGGFDPDLDRRVAIKLLRPDVFGRRTESARARLLREARAMAKLSHENVVTVHEVGFSDGRLFVAMEHVQGGTLRDTIGAAPPWREVLRPLLAAGRGLAAAHRAGLVHRDFKPDNVLVDREGRVKVSDFGLVSLAEDADQTADSDSAERSDSSDSGEKLGATLTRTGTVVGTPAYMAPEQHAGRGAGRRSDQFSYCVTLWEALYGVRPFGGNSLATVVAAVRSGTIDAPPGGRGVPRWLRRVVARGLSADPGERWPSMDALLVAIDSGLSARRRRTSFAAMGVVGTLVVGFATWQARSTPEPGCDSVARLAGVWDDARRTAVREALASSERPYAEDTWTRVRDRLDEHTQAWTEAHGETCRAQTRPGVQSAAVLERRMTCLDRNLAQVEALTRQLAQSGDTVVDRAAKAVHALPAVARCRDVERLLSDASLDMPAESRAAIAELEAAVAEVETMIRLGRARDALDAVAPLVEQAEAVEFAPLLARVLELHGRLHFKNGDAAAAEPVLRRAAQTAARAEAAAVESRAWTGLVYVVGQMQMQPERALGLSEAARAAALRAGDDALLPPLLMAIGAAQKMQGEPEDALKTFEDALTMAEAAWGDDSLLAALAANNIGTVLGDLGRHEESEAMASQAIERLEALMGSGHPNVAGLLNNRGLARTARGDFDGAAEDFDRALEIKRHIYGEDSPQTVLTRNNLGNLALHRGDFETAASHYQRAYDISSQREGDVNLSTSGALENLAIAHRQLGRLDEAEKQLAEALRMRQATLGRDHVKVAEVLINLGWLQYARERYDEAMATHRAALEIQEQHLAPEHPQCAMSRIGMAAALQGKGECGQAIPLYRRGLQDSAAAMGADHARLAEPRAQLALCLVETGEVDEALPMLEAALAALGRAGVQGDAQGHARFALAKGQLAAGNEDEARQTARAALEYLRSHPAAHATDLLIADIESWLDAH